MPLASKPRLSFQLLALRSLTVVVGCLGFLWGVSNIARGEGSDVFWDIEARLLRFEVFSRASSIAVLESAAGQDLNPCDNHAQRALMLIETRARQTLGCTPRDSFVWLLLFGMEIEHGILDEHSFDLLAMSYETAPNEAWIAIRRIVVAMPVVRVAPEPIQQKVLMEFQDLIRHGFVEASARSYWDASASTRSLLQSRIDQLDPRSQRNFSDALQKLRS